MIQFFIYTDKQWNAIRTVIRDALGLDVDRIERQITRTVGNPITWMQSLRDRIEIVASLYHFHSANQNLRRAELIALRKDTENLRASIIDALAVPGTKYDPSLHVLRPGLDGDIVVSTERYFTKLLRNLDRQIEQAGQRPIQ
jgi:hypothetical protein